LLPVGFPFISTQETRTENPILERSSLSLDSSPDIRSGSSDFGAATTRNNVPSAADRVACVHLNGFSK